MSQRDILKRRSKDTLQTIWSRKFWGTPRDEAFLRRLDFLPRLSEAVKEKRWEGGVGLQTVLSRCISRRTQTPAAVEACRQVPAKPR